MSENRKPLLASDKMQTGLEGFLTFYFALGILISNVSRIVLKAGSSAIFLHKLLDYRNKKNFVSDNQILKYFPLDLTSSIWAGSGTKYI